MNVLIAEDDALAAQEIDRELRSLGHQVVGIAETGRRAVEMARMLEPELALLDVAMPGLDGIDAAKEILATKAIPIIMVTGHAEPEMVSRAAAAGVFTYLLKPVRARDLGTAIQIALARFGELQALHRQVRDLREALEVRKVVEQAKGILMRRLQVPEADAFRMLQRRAASQRKSIREIAEAVWEADRFYRDLEAVED
jgi:response regulator NasT